MTILPFILSFLLLLVIGSGALFNSLRSSRIERTIILAKKNGDFFLQSESAHEEYKDLKKREKNRSPKPKTPTGKKTHINMRDTRLNLPHSKFNLSSLLDGKVANPFLRDSAIRLIELLYKDTEFFQGKNLAAKIVDEMISKKGDSLLDLFPNDPELSEIYYKMVKGTNTGYPRLEEYFIIDKSAPPLFYLYMPRVTLEAIFGVDLAQLIIDEETSRQENFNHLSLKAFIEKHQTIAFDTNRLNGIFSFKKGKKYPRGYIDSESQVMSVR